MAEIRRRGLAGTATSPPDLSEWICRAVTIEDPHESRVSIIPFALWPAQAQALATIRENPQTIILKARQLGMSWLVLAYALWLCLYHEHQTVMVFSKDQDSANEMIRRVKGMYLRLSEKPSALEVDNVQTLTWENGSRVKSFAATEDAGSSFTASLTILDEFSKMRYADELYTAVKPTIDDGGRIVIISTAKGEGNPFHKLWQAAVKHINAFTPIFLPWQARPGRDAAWYARTASDAISPALHQQEYPANPAEAFASVGEDRFLPDTTLWDACRETLPALGREPMVVGIDAGVKNDSFGMVGVTRHPQRHNDIAVRFVQEWKPGGRLLNFQGTDDAPGPEMVLRRLCRDYNVVCCPYDPAQMADMASRMSAEGVVWMREFLQGADRLEADKQLLDLITQRRLAHDGNDALRRHVNNANRKPDSETRRLRIIKREESLKIDLVIALSMASRIAFILDI